MFREEEILEFWDKNEIFKKSLAKGRRAKPFIFYEGPPYANGRPGIHHVLARAYKDVILRYKTMRGFLVQRRAGWDTHGLPTEMEVEKKLGIKSKREIEEKIGVERFIDEAKKSIFLYKGEWEKMTKRMGYWLDLENAYVTMTAQYIESLWWIVKEIAHRGLLYEAYKVLPWCPRCETALSSHELAQGYKTITEDSIIIKFSRRSEVAVRPSSSPKSFGEQNPRTFFLAWTTTPWTLPANVALAVNPQVDYVTVEIGKENFIVAKNLAPNLFPNAKIIETKKGKELVGERYVPLPLTDTRTYEQKGAYRIIGADFVSTEDGTGIVHIAPAFGEDDMNVGIANNLPLILTIDESGRFTQGVPRWNGIFVKDADAKIIGYLEARGLLWKKVPYSHEYPFCWRCDSPTLYMARLGWWVKMSILGKQLLRANKKVNWHPGHLRDGRFGEWLQEVKDWAFSRERYWGTPLPVWRCEKCKKWEVMGELQELERRRYRKANRYFLLRHGKRSDIPARLDHPSRHGELTVSTHVDDEIHLSEEGKKDIYALAKRLKLEGGFDAIFSSDYIRAKETVGILAPTLGVPVIYDKRLRELDHGTFFQGKKVHEYLAYFTNPLERFTKIPEGGENLNMVKARMMDFLRELQRTREGQKFLIVSHGDPLWILEGALANFSDEEMLKARQHYIKQGEVREVRLRNFPYNKEGNLDIHKPYVDEILLRCACGGSMKRVPEVIDVWFDSGAMPFAANHFPFAFKKREKLDFPADYIAEAIDQTRGWFYTLLAVSVLLGREAPYKNVLSLGFILDEKGKKMSKSRGNVVLPDELFSLYGADAVRWYFFTVNQPWDTKLFSQHDVKAAKQKFLDILANALNFYQMYASQKKRVSLGSVKHVLDRWVLAKLDEVERQVSHDMDTYEVVKAARALENFLGDDFSRWYIRRSRERIKGKEKAIVSNVLREVLLRFSIVAAPFIPFITEYVYRSLGGKKESVHLEEWSSQPKFKISEKSLLMRDMEGTRRLISLALESRAKVGNKVRQPLKKLKISLDSRSLYKRKPLKKEFVGLIKGEVNVKEVEFSDGIKDEVWLDTVLTPDLKEEGEVRELTRHIQDMRRKAGFGPSDIIFARIKKIPSFFKYQKKIMKDARIKKIEWSSKEGVVIEKR